LEEIKMSQNQPATDKATLYQQQLHPWCIVQRLANMQNRMVARFRRRNDADDHLRILRQLAPSTQHILVFDPVPEQSEVKAGNIVDLHMPCVK
jgi:hypothetical protein